MKRSSQRILATQIGSLPRPKALWELIDAKDKNQAYDQSALDTQLKSAVTAMMRKQVEAGIDIPPRSWANEPYGNMRRFPSYY